MPGRDVAQAARQARAGPGWGSLWPEKRLLSPFSGRGPASGRLGSISGANREASVTHCYFCRIAAGSAPAHILHRDDAIVAFLDPWPIRPGHIQIVPREHFAYFDELPGPLAGRIVEAGQGFAKALKAIYGVERVAFLFTGGDIPHAHAHVVPMHEKTDITSRRYIAERELTFRPAARASEAELAGVAERLRATPVE